MVLLTSDAIDQVNAAFGPGAMNASPTLPSYGLQQPASSFVDDGLGHVSYDGGASWQDKWGTPVDANTGQALNAGGMTSGGFDLGDTSGSWQQPETSTYQEPTWVQDYSQPAKSWTDESGQEWEQPAYSSGIYDDHQGHYVDSTGRVVGDAPVAQSYDVSASDFGVPFGSYDANGGNWLGTTPFSPSMAYAAPQFDLGPQAPYSEAVDAYKQWFAQPGGFEDYVAGNPYEAPIPPRANAFDVVRAGAGQQAGNIAADPYWSEFIKQNYDSDFTDYAANALNIANTSLIPEDVLGYIPDYGIGPLNPRDTIAGLTSPIGLATLGAGGMGASLAEDLGYGLAGKLIGSAAEGALFNTGLTGAQQALTGDFDPEALGYSALLGAGLGAAFPALEHPLETLGLARDAAGNIVRSPKTLHDFMVDLDTRINEPAYIPGEAQGMTVYHGSNGPLDGPIREGTDVTTDPAAAAKFAEIQTRLAGGEPTVHAFEADPNAVTPVEGSVVPGAYRVAKPEGVTPSETPRGPIPEDVRPAVSHGPGDPVGRNTVSLGGQDVGYVYDTGKGIQTRATVLDAAGNETDIGTFQGQSRAADAVAEQARKGTEPPFGAPPNGNGRLPSGEPPRTEGALARAPQQVPAPARGYEPGKPVGSRALKEGEPVRFAGKDWEVARDTPQSSREVQLRDAEGATRMANRDLLKNRPAEAPVAPEATPTKAELDAFARENLNVPTPETRVTDELRGKLREAGLTREERAAVYRGATPDQIEALKRAEPQAIAEARGKIARGEPASSTEAAAVAASGQMPPADLDHLPPEPPRPPTGGGDGSGGMGGGEPEAAAVQARTKWEQVLNALNLPRQLITAWDLSAPMRQGIVESVAHPLSAIKASGTMLKALASQDFYDALYQHLREGPEAALREKAGLYLSGARDAKLNLREEAVMSSWLDKIPGYRASQRAYVAYLDKLRADVFDNFARKNPTATEAELREYANFVNHATGRGTGRVLDAIGPGTNAFFFSPRYTVSRLQTPVDFAKALTLNTAAKRQIARDFGTFIAAGAGGLALLSQVPGVKVSLDPSSADFGKVRLGDMRWDFWGGFQQVARLGFNLATAESADEATDIFGRWLRTKGSPLTSTLTDLRYRESFLGHNVSLTDIDFDNPLLKNSIIPLFVQDVLQSFAHEGLMGAVKALPAFVGVGVQDYGNQYDDRTRWLTDHYGPQSQQVGGKWEPSQLDAFNKANGGPLISSNPTIAADQIKTQAQKQAWFDQQTASDTQLANGAITPKQWRDQRGSLLDQEAGYWKKAYEDRDPTAPVTPLEEYGHQIELATTNGVTDWDKVDAWKATQTPQVLDYIARNSGLNDTQTEKDYRTARDKLDASGFFDTRDAAWAKIAKPGSVFAGYDSYDAWRQAMVGQLVTKLQGNASFAALDPQQQRQEAGQIFDGDAGVQQLQDAMSQQRAQWVKDHPAEASLAWTWGYLDPGKANGEEAYLINWRRTHPAGTP